jgi:hypothetical protein
MEFLRKNKYIIASAAIVVIGLVISYRARASAFARKWIGISEKGFNSAFSNDVFQAMLKNVGWKGGEAWCMYFAKAVHYESYPKDREQINILMNGSTMRSWQNVKNDKSGTYRIITSGSPKLGDIAIWTNTTNTSKGHAGVVIKSTGENFTTVEGNTNAGGSSEGDSVMVKERPLKYNQQIPNSSLKLLGFIRKVQRIF